MGGGLIMKIAYGLSGVGRGHTMRASAIGSKLIANGHDVLFFSCGDATEPLTTRFGPNRINFLPTPHFTLINGKLNAWKTSKDFVKFMVKERKTILTLSDQLKEENYDVVISDFEPLLSRAALNANIPCLAFNSQNFVTICKIPMKYRYLSIPIAFINAIIVPSPDYTIVSKPVRLDMKSNKGMIVGPIIREHILDKSWKGTHNHILMYRSLASDWPTEEIVEWANSKGLTVYFYGKLTPAEEKLATNNAFIHRPISETQFVEDMINAKLVIGTSGTQLIGELAYLGVPAILIPETGQTEQELNALLANDSYPNMATITAKKITPEKLEELIQTLDGLSIRHTEDGSKEAYQKIEEWLNQLKT